MMMTHDHAYNTTPMTAWDIVSCTRLLKHWMNCPTLYPSVFNCRDTTSSKNSHAPWNWPSLPDTPHFFEQLIHCSLLMHDSMYCWCTFGHFFDELCCTWALYTISSLLLYYSRFEKPVSYHYKVSHKTIWS